MHQPTCLLAEALAAYIREPFVHDCVCLTSFTSNDRLDFVVGLAVGTRPDCVDEPVLELLESYARRMYVLVELGLQSIFDRSLEWMNRGHDYACFPDAIARSRGRGFEMCAHVILGIPGESHDDMLATAREVARLQVDAVKLHNLYAVKDTPLADQLEPSSCAVRIQRDVRPVALLSSEQ